MYESLGSTDLSDTETPYTAHRFHLKLEVLMIVFARWSLAELARSECRCDDICAVCSIGAAVLELSKDLIV